LRTVNEIASEYMLHPNQVSSWKQRLLEEGPGVFSRKREHGLMAAAEQEAALYEQIGRLEMELEWVKKKLGVSNEVKRTTIEINHPDLSIRRQCELLGLSRASLYRKPAGETPLNLELMRLIDTEYTRRPFFGYRKMHVRLQRQGYVVNRKRVARLMRLMGLQAVCPWPRTSIPDQQHRKYPYLLRGLKIERPNQVWAADITYVPLPSGFMYLVAIMDWFSRFVLAWQLSNTLDSLFCTDALRLGQPDIFNTEA
jgi:putative transposase